ncbi:MAG: glycosyltransferase family 2 protein [Phycisphaeraceae bacterium]|nr:glycosyltransferase family 2 protein [Phycisphaeraceae bacterium]
MPAFSVVICGANCADTLPAACQSAQWADELVFVDSGSTDQTPQIARRYAHQYVVEPWRGYTGQKKFAADLARNDWVLVLDADEECSPELAKELQALSQAELDRHDVFLVRRRNYIFGRHVRAWDPDWQSRVIHRRRCHWPQEALHDARLPSDPSRQARLTGRLNHKRHSSAGFSDYFSGRRLDGRLLDVARQMHARGKRCHWWDLAFRPALTFLKFYILKRGFLDGLFGLALAQKSALTTQLKYAALWTIQNRYESPSKPPADK